MCYATCHMLIMLYVCIYHTGPTRFYWMKMSDRLKKSYDMFSIYFYCKII